MVLTWLRQRLFGGSGSARQRRGSGPRFRPGVEQLGERCLPAAVQAVPLAALTLEPGHLGLLRSLQRQKHLGPLFAALPDLGAGQTTSAPNTFVGSVPATKLLVGIVLGPGEALAYACDGGSGHDIWLRGTVQGQTLVLIGKKGERIGAQVQGDTVSGTLTLPGGPALAFTADRAVEAQTGLFRSVARFGRQQVVLTTVRLMGVDRGAFRTTTVHGTVSQILSGWVI
jgi:hypothetical protein